VQQGETLREEELLDKYSVLINSNNPKASVIRKKQLRKIKEME